MESDRSCRSVLSFITTVLRSYGTGLYHVRGQQTTQMTKILITARMIS